MLPLLAVLVVLALIAGGLWYFIRSMLDQPVVKPKPKIQKITIVTPPPPPPPPPPKMERPPEPEERIEQPEPEPEPDEPPPEEADADQTPPGDDLGLDAEGSGAGDGFGLIGRKGGRGLIGGRGGTRFGWYAGLVKQDLETVLSGIDAVRKSRYSAVIEIWLSDRGGIERVKIVGSTGDPQLDDALERAITGAGSLSRPPPEDLPLPIRLRITSRG